MPARPRVLLNLFFRSSSLVRDLGPVGSVSTASGLYFCSFVSENLLQYAPSDYSLTLTLALKSEYLPLPLPFLVMWRICHAKPFAKPRLLRNSQCHAQPSAHNIIIMQRAWSTIFARSLPSPPVNLPSSLTTPTRSPLSARKSQRTRWQEWGQPRTR